MQFTTPCSRLSGSCVQDMSRKIGLSVLDLTQDPQGLPLAGFVRHNSASSRRKKPVIDSQDTEIIQFFEKMIHYVQASPTALKLLHKAAEQGWHVRLEDIGDSAYMLDHDMGLIVVNSMGLPLSTLARSEHFSLSVLMAFLRSLRAVGHEDKLHRMIGANAPDAILLLNRIAGADCDTVALQMAWELRAAGFGEVWRNVIASPFGDMALAFSRHMEDHPASLYDGCALAAAFTAWFDQPARANAIDHITLDWLDGLLRLDGAAVFGKHRASVDMIAELTQLPDGRHYSKHVSGNLLKDPDYAGLHDPVNQAHFMHILYDMQVVMVGQVPFRDPSLAARIFPGYPVSMTVTPI